MDTDTDASNKEIFFTDIDLEPITCDINAAHFDGFLYEIADFCQRTGKFLPDWMLDKSKANLRQLDDSDNTIFIHDSPDGSETFAIGVYVDNLQVVHSVAIDADGVPAVQTITHTLLNSCAFSARIGR